jgi:hypothetical protein
MSGSISYELFKAKDLLQSISILSPTIAQGAAITFDTNKVLLGDAITHTLGSTEFNLLVPGYYSVIFTVFAGNIDVTNNASIALMVDNSIVPGTTIHSSIPGINAVVGLTTQNVVEVLPNTTSILKVINTTTNSATFTNPNIVIQKIG